MLCMLPPSFPAIHTTPYKIPRLLWLVEALLVTLTYPFLPFFTAFLSKCSLPIQNSHLIVLITSLSSFDVPTPNTLISSLAIMPLFIQLSMLTSMLQRLDWALTLARLSVASSAKWALLCYQCLILVPAQWPGPSHLLCQSSATATAMSRNVLFSAVLQHTQSFTSHAKSSPLYLGTILLQTVVPSLTTIFLHLLYYVRRCFPANTPCPAHKCHTMPCCLFPPTSMPRMFSPSPHSCLHSGCDETNWWGVWTWHDDQ